MEERIKPRTQESRDRRRTHMKRRRQQELIRKMIFFVVLIVVVIGGAFLVKKFSPSKERADLNKYYGIKKENQLAITIDNKVIGAKGMLIDGEPYVEYSIVRDYLNERFYLDSGENMLLYTLPDGTIRADVGSREYTLKRETKTEDYVILKMDGNTAYVALDFVQKYTNLSFEMYKDPARVMIVRKWGDTTVAVVKKSAQLRTKDNIKSPILTNVSKKDCVTIIDTKEGWKKVRTEDGIVGYMKSGSLKKETVQTLSRDFEEQVYPNISKDYTINLAWHLVASRADNDTVLEKIANGKGMTTISPTWFSLKDTKGNINSLASSQYVTYAHQQNVEVWALVKDFDGGIGSQEETYELLRSTGNRENLINRLIAEALKTKIDGINVDFEYVSKECSEHYLQFLRELSLKCRQNEIILSVDNPVLSKDTTQYNLKEQGNVVDYVILMSYDEYGADSEVSGPGASYDFVKKAVEDALEVVPKEKLIHAIPLYSRLWEEVEEAVSNRAYGMNRIQNIIAEAGETVALDKETGLNYAEWEADGATYKVWVEDLSSMEAKLKLMKDHKLAGVAGWRLGFESSDAWELILKYVN